jgi:hypothetical protein
VFHRLAAEGRGHEAALAGLELARCLAEAEEGATRPDALRGIAGVLADLPPGRLPSHLLDPIRLALRGWPRKEREPSRMRSSRRASMSSGGASIPRGSFIRPRTPTSSCSGTTSPRASGGRRPRPPWSASMPPASLGAARTSASSPGLTRP